MSADLDALVASPWWRWMPLGWFTKPVHPEWRRGYVVRSNLTHAWVAWDREWPDVIPLAALRPDPTDPATLGCLLALAREAWEDPALQARREFPGWWSVLDQFGGPTEAAALIAAILAAPPPGVERG